MTSTVAAYNLLCPMRRAGYLPVVWQLDATWGSTRASLAQAKLLRWSAAMSHVWTAPAVQRAAAALAPMA